MRNTVRRSLVAITLGLFVSGAARAADPVCPPDGGERRTVARLSADGLLILDDGSEARIIGILAPLPPRDGDAIAWPPYIAHREFLERTLLGKTVRLASEGRERDRHDVRLAHVAYHLEAGEGWLAGELVGRGLARVDPTVGQGQCAGRLLVLEREARAAGRGLWQLPHYTIRDAGDTAALQGDALHFVIAEGIVKDVVRRAGEIRLSFDPERRRGFSALIIERDRRAIEASGIRAGDLVGLRVRVRGWVEMKEGPFIRISHGAQIEPLEPVEQRELPPAQKRKRPAR